MQVELQMYNIASVHYTTVQSESFLNFDCTHLPPGENFLLLKVLFSETQLPDIISTLYFDSLFLKKIIEISVAILNFLLNLIDITRKLKSPTLVS